MSKKDIHIVGAGPAGLSAAINLKREGYHVIVHEAEKEIGGPPSWHPSIHCTPMDFDTFEKYTGLDVRPAFKDCTDHLNYYKDGAKTPFSDFIGTIPNMYCVIRGPHEKSLDNYLYQMAVKEGVEVYFNDKWRKPDFENAPENTIIATGFGQSAYEDLGMKFTPFYGYWTRQECPPDDVHISIYEGDFTNEYGYSGSKDGVWYSLIFARGDITQEGLDRFAALLKEKTGVSVEKWGRFTGTTTRYAKLRDEKFVFAGTASGFIDPAQGYGILAAMLSGKIAAWAITEPEKAQTEYNKFIEPIQKHIRLKFQQDYRSSIHFRMGQVWLDIPTIKPRIPDYELEE